MFQKSKKQTPTVSQLDSAPISTVIGSDITFTGDVKGEETMKIEGQVIGTIEVKKGIILGEKAIVTGDLESDNIIIYGTVNGNIKCQELILKSTGKVNGDITVESVEIEMGCKYNGQLNMTPQFAITKNETNTSKQA